LHVRREPDMTRDKTKASRGKDSAKRLHSPTQTTMRHHQVFCCGEK
jgi:hypothetical protein